MKYSKDSIIVGSDDIRDSVQGSIDSVGRRQATWLLTIQLSESGVLTLSDLCQIGEPWSQNGKNSGASHTVITPTSKVSGTPILTKSENEYLPGP